MFVLLLLLLLLLIKQNSLIALNIGLHHHICVKIGTAFVLINTRAMPQESTHPRRLGWVSVYMSIECTVILVV